MKIELGKTYKTRSGNSTYKVVCVDAPGEHPVIAYDVEGGVVSVFTSCGRLFNNGVDSGVDLISEVVPKIVRYMNVYFPEDCHSSRGAADMHADANRLVGSRIACIRIEYSPGQFDE